jgi:hypothetical protein
MRGSGSPNDTLQSQPIGQVMMNAGVTLQSARRNRWTYGVPPDVDRNTISIWRNTMAKHSVALLTVCIWLVAAAAHAQQCLHGVNESTDQAARKREALTAARTINNIQVNQPGAAKGQFLRHEELSSSPFAARMRQSPNETVKRMSLNPGTDVVPNWQLTVDVTSQGYWFMIKDKSDPCGFAFVSNQTGVILQAEPIR